MPAEANLQTRQLRGVLHGLGAMPATPVTVLSDGADGPRSLGEAASPVQPIMCWTGFISRCGSSMSLRRPRAGPTPRRVISRSALVVPNDTAPIAAVARKVARLLGDLETYVSGQSDIIIDYATARRCEEPISTAITESTVQWLLHRRMNAQQQMRWSPRGAHLILKVGTSVMNGTLNRDLAIAERWARRPFRRAA